MGRAEEQSRYDAAAETRQFSDPDTRWNGQVPETRLSDRMRDRSEQEPGLEGTDGPDSDPSRVWEQSDEPGHTHDPHEVTVQLDGVGRELEDWLVQQAKEAPGGQDSDGPVFVDESGRRRSRLRRIGIFVGLACAVYAVVIGVTVMSGNSNAPWLPGLAQQDDEPANKVDTSPEPADPAEPSETATVSPSAGVSPTAGATTAPDTGATADPSGEASAPANTVPRPSTSAKQPDADPTKKDPGTDPSPSRPDPSPPATSPSPDPSASESTGTDGGTGTGTGTDSEPVAGDAPAPDPVASGAAPSSSSSPENIV
ncbi:hypothetical protein [Streptomyces spongiae]|uniref:hypothetical protein n=1 Tax=Streptomyces spongiae TaxID=565072 RepID=UPI001883893D|nr:hypothetical protein [Streptomyces spongiae]